MKRFILALATVALSNVSFAAPYDGIRKHELVQEITKLLAHGRHDHYDVGVGSSREMVKQYIHQKTGDSLDAFGEYTFSNDVREISPDTESAGVLARDAALEVIESNLSPDVAHRDDVYARFKRLYELDGVELGFDNFEQNGCAAPTPFILILDTTSGEVDGIDLNPCVE